MGIALQKLAEEDPTFRVHTDPETAQTIISGMGELHLDIIVDRLLREFHVGCTVGNPQVAYRETIRKSVKAEGKFVRQSGGKGTAGWNLLRWNPAKASNSTTKLSAALSRKNTSGLLKPVLKKLWKTA